MKFPSFSWPTHDNFWYIEFSLLLPKNYFSFPFNFFQPMSLMDECFHNIVESSSNLVIDLCFHTVRFRNAPLYDSCLWHLVTNGPVEGLLGNVLWIPAVAIFCSCQMPYFVHMINTFFRLSTSLHIFPICPSNF